MLNAANWGYSIDDYVSLYKEKAQFAEPDVVILTVNGNDILDMYFSHRNRFARNKQPQNPSETEKFLSKALSVTNRGKKHLFIPIIHFSLAF
jgi:hypothetical protein